MAAARPARQRTVPRAGAAAATDWELVERAQRDPKAFAALYERYCQRTYRLIYARVGDRSLAEDLTSEVFFKALRNLKRYRHSGHFAAWLHQIATHLIADHYRAQRLQVDLSAVAGLAGAGPSTVDAVLRRDLNRQIWERIDHLPADQRAAMIFRFGEDLGSEEIGAILGKTSGAVRILLHRGVCRLRRELAPLDQDLAS